MECDYDLRGISSDRCPECGTPIDREYLRRWLYRNDLGLLGQTTATFEHYVDVAIASLIRPSQLGRRMPPQPQMRLAFAYSTACRLLSIAIVPFGTFFLTQRRVREDDYGPLILIASIVFISSYLCEVFIAAGLRWMVQSRKSVPQVHGYAFWRCLCHCFSTYLVVSATAVALSIMLVSTLFATAAGILAVCWWWWTLAAAVMARSESTMLRSMALVLIPVVAVLSVGFGFFLGAVVIATFRF